jgi:glycine cleavage system aminomethyltransferase T
VAREALGVSNEEIPFRTAAQISVADVPVLAQRITYVGELGYELYVERESAVAVWDALFASASPEPVGYQALDSFRIEKGYRYFGSDMTARIHRSTAASASPLRRASARSWIATHRRDSARCSSAARTT